MSTKKERRFKLIIFSAVYSQSLFGRHLTKEERKETLLTLENVLMCTEYFDDKVREGAELLSKLFGGQVDNYYSSSR